VVRRLGPNAPKGGALAPTPVRAYDPVNLEQGSAPRYANRNYKGRHSTAHRERGEVQR
jgi:hypothetical protein